MARRHRWAEDCESCPRPATIGAETGAGSRKGGRGRKMATTRPSPVTWATARAEVTCDGYHLVLPVPERTNAIWRQWGGRTLVSKKHRRDKAVAPQRFGRLEPFRGDVAVRLVWVREKRAGDVDSRLKAALDLLTLIGVWVDDKQVQDVQVLRVDDRTRAPGLYCWVWPADTPRVAPSVFGRPDQYCADE